MVSEGQVDEDLQENQNTIQVADGPFKSEEEVCGRNKSNLGICEVMGNKLSQRNEMLEDTR